MAERMPHALCLFCGEPDVPGHPCDGRQGAIEAAACGDPGAFTRARTTDPDTSHLAAAPDRARDHDRAYALLRMAADGLTDFELGNLMSRQQTSAGKRRGELRDAGLVRDSGQRRRAPSGSMAIVWVAVR
jgi:hypothetical protein